MLANALYEQSPSGHTTHSFSLHDFHELNNNLWMNMGEADDTFMYLDVDRDIYFANNAIIGVK
jgi:hypothetical protein